MHRWRDILAKKEAMFLDKSSDRIYRNILAVSSFLIEVENGGIVQYLDNDSGNYFSTLVSAAIDIKCPILKSITGHINVMFPEGVVPMERNERGSVIDQMLDDFDDEDPFDELVREYENGVSCIESCFDHYLLQHGFE